MTIDQYTQLVFQKAIQAWRSKTLISFSTNLEIICLSLFKDGFDTNMINFIIFLHLLTKFQNDHSLLKYNLSDKSLNNSQLYRSYHISILKGEQKFRTGSFF
jgi:glycopeptide antibiotics resistance protein